MLCGLTAGLAAACYATSDVSHAKKRPPQNWLVKAPPPPDPAEVKAEIDRWSSMYQSPYPPTESNTKVFMEIESKGTDLGRFEMELFDDCVPITAKNFRDLCKGDKIVKGQPFSFKGCSFHRVISTNLVQGGDIEHNDGSGGYCETGKFFDDESFEGRAGNCGASGLLAMANAGPNTNGSQFFINIAPNPSYSGAHVVFGQVVKGWGTVMAMAKRGSLDGMMVPYTLMIKDCGVVE